MNGRPFRTPGGFPRFLLIFFSKAPRKTARAVAIGRRWSPEQSKGGLVEALCLAGDSPDDGRYTRASDRCQAWKLNSHGAIDDPHCGDEAVALYAEEESEE
jgi:hypothetical protein